MKIEFTTPRELGEELWFMYGNIPHRLFISEIVVRVSSCTTEESWYTQLLIKILNKTVTTDYAISYSYTAKVEGSICNEILTTKSTGLYFGQIKLYDSKEALLKSF